MLKDLIESLDDRDLQEQRLKSTLTEESDHIRTIIIEREKFDEQKNHTEVAQTRAIKKRMLEKLSIKKLSIKYKKIIQKIIHQSKKNYRDVILAKCCLFFDKLWLKNCKIWLQNSWLQKFLA